MIKEIKDKKYLAKLIEQGEHEHQDFKYQISDAKKIARSISAFANNSGGHLLIGVKDNGNISGIKSEEEIFMVDQAAQLYCRPTQAVEYTIYRHEGKCVLFAQINEAEKKPVKATNASGEWRAYYRVDDENILANPLHVKILQNAGNSSVQTIINFTEKEQEFLCLVEDKGEIYIDECPMLMHLSRKTTNELIQKLCEFQILKLCYKGGKCFVALANC